MGLIISRFRKKKSTIETLEDIDKEINRLQKSRKENQDRQKRIATGLVIYSIILYVVTAIIFFLVYFPDTWPLRLLYSLPLLAFPFLIWGIKKILHWYFVKRIAGNDLALRDLREKKKQILEDVMETETYKKAKEILEKFDPARFKKLEKDEQGGSLSPTSSPLSTSGTVLLQRKPAFSQPVSQPSTPQPRIINTPNIRPPVSARPTPNPYANTPLRAPTPSVTPAMSMGRGHVQQQMTRAQVLMPQQAMPPQMGRGYGPPGPPMPRSVLPKDRGTMDRLMDYLVGDGPENRYALICRACYSHNGMALKEEFEYLSFRCCYCFVMNPAKKQRPLAPRLEFFTPNPKAIRLTKPEESDEEESESDDDDEDNKENPDNKVKESSSLLKAAPTASNPNQSRSKLPIAGSKNVLRKSQGTPLITSGASSTAASSVSDGTRREVAVTDVINQREKEMEATRTSHSMMSMDSDTNENFSVEHVKEGEKQSSSDHIEGDDNIVEGYDHIEKVSSPSDNLMPSVESEEYELIDADESVASSDSSSKVEENVSSRSC